MRVFAPSSRRPGVPLGAAVCDAALIAVAAVAAFEAARHNGFVNWDDPTVLVDNAHLVQPGVFGWAFSTTLIGHYQPFSWLLWSTAAHAFGVSAGPLHTMGLALHALNGILVYACARLCLERTALPATATRLGSTAAGLLFVLHPVTVEPVAWASAFPYVTSLTVLLAATLAYLSGHRVAALIAYAVSLLLRATALGYPLVLLALDVYPLRRTRDRSAGRLIVEKVPFVAVAVGAAAAEWAARDVATLRDVGIGPRLTLAATAPFVYLGRLIWPVRLSPLDVLPIAPTFEPWPLIAALSCLAIATGVLWRIRRGAPAAIQTWLIYLALLAPVAGLTPAGLQATADRYLYVPLVACAIAAGAAIATMRTRPAARVVSVLACAAVALGLGIVTHRQSAYWRDSITLWTRAIEIDPRNDVASYNLAVALAEAGRDDDAIARYKQTLALVPDHDVARRELTRLEASRLERDADAQAAAGRLDQAATTYARVLALDSTRVHARAARGVALVQRGRLDEGAADLRTALAGGVTDVEASNALAYVLAREGDSRGAAAVLERAVSAHPEDVNVKHNLARLLATAPDGTVRDGRRAVQLALDVCNQTGDRDPRALDTLGAAYAAAGQMDAARATLARAVSRARDLGDDATAAAIAQHAATLSRTQRTQRTAKN